MKSIPASKKKKTEEFPDEHWEKYFLKMYDNIPSFKEVEETLLENEGKDILAVPLNNDLFYVNKLKRLDHILGINNQSINNRPCGGISPKGLHPILSSVSVGEIKFKRDKTQMLSQLWA